MTIYYIDSANGSNSNTGTSETAAFQSVDVVSNLKLKPGDSILLARGSVFTDTLTLTKSGAEGNPITIGAYGTGDAPAFSGNIGILATKTANVVLKDVAFIDTTGAAIYGNNVKNWTIDNITAENTGTLAGIGGIFFKRGSNVSVTNSSFDAIAGDGVFVQYIDGLKVENNSFKGLHGSAADGIQFTDSSNVVVKGNFIDQSTSPDSTKGGIVGNNVENVVMTDNVIIGGSFGMSINGNHVVLDGNSFTGHDKYSWSASILIGGNWDLSDYTITNNKFSDSYFGVSITGLRGDQVIRTDINISNNVFEDMGKAALKIDKPATGTFDNNILINSGISIIKGEGFTNPYTIVSNTLLTTEQAAALANPAPTAPTVTPVETTAPVEHLPQVTTPVAELPAAEVTPAPAPTPEPAPAPAPAPVISKPVVNVAPTAANDMVSLTANASMISGNILTNDHDANGDTLFVRTVGSGKIGATGLDIAGAYGTLHIEANGDYTYNLDASAVGQLKHATKMVEKFSYKVSDTMAVDSAALIIDLSAYVHAHDGVML